MSFTPRSTRQRSQKLCSTTSLLLLLNRGEGCGMKPVPFLVFCEEGKRNICIYGACMNFYIIESFIQWLRSLRRKMTINASEVMIENNCSLKEWQVSRRTQMTLQSPTVKGTSISRNFFLWRIPVKCWDQCQMGHWIDVTGYQSYQTKWGQWKGRVMWPLFSLSRTESWFSFCQGSTACVIRHDQTPECTSICMCMCSCVCVCVCSYLHKPVSVYVCMHVCEHAYRGQRSTSKYFKKVNQKDTPIHIFACYFKQGISPPPPHCSLLLLTHPPLSSLSLIPSPLPLWGKYLSSVLWSLNQQQSLQSHPWSSCERGWHTSQTQSTVTLLGSQWNTRGTWMKLPYSNILLQANIQFWATYAHTTSNKSSFSNCVHTPGTAVQMTDQSGNLLG